MNKIMTYCIGVTVFAFTLTGCRITAIQEPQAEPEAVRMPLTPEQDAVFIKAGILPPLEHDTSRGLVLPIQLTPKQDAALVEAGMLPPLEE
jgi:hypothetical protein